MFSTIIKMIQNYWPLFLQGAGMTILISLICVAAGTLLGVFMALMRLSKNRLLKGIASCYIEIVRGTPLLLQLFIFTLGLPAVGIKIPFLAGSIFALSLNSAAYVAEIIRSGIQAVDSGQAEAARSLGMPSGMTMRQIILPQAVKNILPALGNEFITLIKESSLASTFFVGELMTARQTISGITFLVMEPLIIVGVIYFCLTFTLSRLLGLVERRLSQGD